VTCVMRCVGVAGQVLKDDAPGQTPEDMYLQGFDPNYADGRGMAYWTQTKADAVVFFDVAALFAMWQAVPTRRPLREDGQPNRPLTAFHVMPEPT
jgi:hypothetical protein